MNGRGMRVRCGERTGGRVGQAEDKTMKGAKRMKRGENRRRVHGRSGGRRRGAGETRFGSGRSRERLRKDGTRKDKEERQKSKEEDGGDEKSGWGKTGRGRTGGQDVGEMRETKGSEDRTRRA